jgi:hypothetical protein
VERLTLLHTRGYAKTPGVTSCHMGPADSQTNPSFAYPRGPRSPRQSTPENSPPRRPARCLPCSSAACAPTRTPARSAPPGPLGVGTAGLTTRMGAGTNSRRWAAGLPPQSGFRHANPPAHSDLHSSTSAGLGSLVRSRDVVYIRRSKREEPLWATVTRCGCLRLGLPGGMPSSWGPSFYPGKSNDRRTYHAHGHLP